MTDAQRSRLRGVMRLAWAFYRTPTYDGSAKDFGNSLKAAWRMVKFNEATAERWKGRQVRFTRDLIPSRKGSGPGGRSSGAYISAKLWR